MEEKNYNKMNIHEVSSWAIFFVVYGSCLFNCLQILGPDTPDTLDSPDGIQDKEIPTDSAPVNTNPFLDDESDSSSWVVVKPKPLPKKRNSDNSSGTTLIESKTPSKSFLPPKAYCAPPPPSNKPTPAAQPRVKTVPTSGNTYSCCSGTSLFNLVAHVISMNILFPCYLLLKSCFYEIIKTIFNNHVVVNV